MYMPVFDQLIHAALLEWSVSEPDASTTVAEWGHFEVSFKKKNEKKRKLVRKSGKTVTQNIQCTCLLIVIIIVYYASKAAK